jgi:hypothetical protein
MVVMRFAALGFAMLAAAGSGLAESLPPPVAVAVAEAKNSCAPDAAKTGPGMLKRQDVNGDGVPDFILDYGEVQCPKGGRLNCGSAGCLTQVFTSMSSGDYRKVLDRNVQSIKFRKVKGVPAMILGLHGSDCGKAGFEQCGETLYWNKMTFSPAH